MDCLVIRPYYCEIISRSGFGVDHLLSGAINFHLQKQEMCFWVMGKRQIMTLFNFVMFYLCLMNICCPSSLLFFDRINNKLLYILFLYFATTFKRFEVQSRICLQSKHVELSLEMKNPAVLFFIYFQVERLDQNVWLTASAGLNCVCEWNIHDAIAIL